MILIKYIDKFTKPKPVIELVLKKIIFLKSLVEKSTLQLKNLKNLT